MMTMIFAAREKRDAPLGLVYKLGEGGRSDNNWPSSKSAPLLDHKHPDCVTYANATRP